MTFLPQQYNVPKGESSYMKLEEGANRFRILSSAITGWQYFNTDTKPVRQKEKFDLIPDDIKFNDDGTFSIKHFWAFVVWDYADSRVKILEITQATIQRAMKIKIDNRKGDAKGYDFIVTRTGKGLNTDYDIDVSEAAPVPPEAEAAFKQKDIDLDALYENKDPFIPKAKPNKEAEEIAKQIDL